MVDIQTEILINVPIEQVYAYASNPSNAPTWYVNINTAEWKTPEPVQLGTLVAFKARFLGRDLAYVYEFVELSENKKVRMKTADGPFPMETTYEFSKVGNNQTKMKLRNQGMPSGFSKLMAPLMSMMMRKAMNKDLIMIKQILEKA